jgi:hypothetical protein
MRVYQPITVLVVFSLLLSACSPVPQASTPVVQIPTNSPPSEATPALPTPTPSPLPSPTATPDPRVYLASLEPVSASVGYESLGVGVYPFTSPPAVKGSPLHAHEQDFKYGLFAHAPSLVEYNLDGQYAALEVSLLMQDKPACGDGVIFKILLDEIPLFTSTLVKASTRPIPITVDVTNGYDLKLIIDQRTGGDCDWAMWGDPLLTRADPAVIAAQAAITPTIDPNLPCANPAAEMNYGFLDCRDIRRIRSQLKSAPDEVKKAWNGLIQRTETLRGSLPTTYDPKNSAGLLWEGSGNYHLRDMGLIYLVTGDKSCARDIIYILELVTRHTHRTVLMTHFAQGEVLVQSNLFAYLAVRDSGLINDEQKAVYDAFFMNQAKLYEQAARQIGNKTPLTSFINRNTAIGSNVSAATIALAFPQDPGMQTLYQRVRPLIDWQIGNYFEADGGWGENTDSYGFRVLEGLVLFAETLLRSQGEDLYSQIYNGRSLNLFCRYYLNTVTPEGDVVAINDTMNNFIDPGVLLLCAYRTKDPNLVFAYQKYVGGLYSAFGQDNFNAKTLFDLVAWSGLDTLEAVPPAYTSLLLPATGLAIFRSGWERPDQFLLLQYTASKVHWEASFGGLMLYDNGPWIVDNGYFLPQWSKQTGFPTDQHATLSLDNRSQERPGGELLAYADLGTTAIASVTAPSYAVLQHTRTVLWIKPWHQWIVVDDAALKDTARHSLQVRWYARGFVMASNENTWRFGRNVNTDTLEVNMLPGLPATYTRIERHYPWDQWIVDAVGVKMDVTYRGKTTRLVASLASLGAGEQAPQVTRVDGEDLTRIESRRGDTTYTWLLPTGASTGTLNGQAGCLVEQAGLMTGYCLMNGTSLVRDGQNLLVSSTAGYVEADLAGGTVYVESNDQNEVTFFWPDAVTTITELGTPLAFSSTGNLYTVQINPGRHVLTIR